MFLNVAAAVNDPTQALVANHLPTLHKERAPALIIHVTFVSASSTLKGTCRLLHFHVGARGIEPLMLSHLIYSQAPAPAG